MTKLNLEPCLPPLWANTGHLQTLIGHLMPSPRIANKGKRVEISLSDGDRGVAFVHEGRTKVTIYLFHGLSGSSDSSYMHRTAQLARDLGHSVIMFNHRGCGEGAGLAVHPYHSGRAEDLSSVIEFGKRIFPNNRHLAIGFSLSANALLLLLTGRRGTTAPDAAVAVNGPIDLENAALALKRGLSRIYDMQFVMVCKKDVSIRKRAGAKTAQVNIPWVSSVHDLDRLYTAPAAGFASREDYYRQCSTAKHLSLIKAPTIILTAKDDPFVDYRNYESAQTSSSVQMHIENFGGHMGYLSKKKTPLGTQRWLDYALYESILSLTV